MEYLKRLVLCFCIHDRGEVITTIARKIGTDIPTTKEDINLVLNRIAMINTKTDDYRAEQTNMQRQVDKHERRHFQVAEKVGVKPLSD